ncbi:hypothetical protein DFA_12305 [Cavenderia fasciculata]|uniref:Uncharacterized protein n=1 Tax=Cavenderia fasciculata TaxID=261658 RepID=F4QD58_CACFS|nr:uncharacterized protein DFA_12305 [Cavenderia fasciculata]EGG14529.1 hypothetical protein DFA_12305 [Cavenderia fasciculata]|eukprot:XP_004353961.1 hypothetical protein DFA_12305 [Cavenderia fasciculata]
MDMLKLALNSLATRKMIQQTKSIGQKSSIASWARPDSTDMYFFSHIINHPNIFQILLENALKGGNYSLALKIKNTTIFDQLSSLVLLGQFVRAISTFFINRVSEAINFVIEWEGCNIIQSTWKDLIKEVLSKERFDILLKLVDSDSQNWFLLECMESLPKECLDTYHLKANRWKRFIKKAVRAGSLAQVGLVIEKYYELGFDYDRDEKKKSKVKNFLSLYTNRDDYHKLHVPKRNLNNQKKN